MIRIRSAQLGDRVELWFEDNGIGIPPEAAPRMFSIFQRAHDDQKYAGTGIGLAIVRKAVERMGGAVRFESELGIGTRFCVNLPRGASS
ncbi:MAG: Phytochrome-like protein cph1 [Verrucomicrobiota bacterium]